MKKPIELFKVESSHSRNFWSEVYSAGNLVVVFSLSRKEDVEDSLVQIGKKLINAFQAEYFTLESKNLQTLKTAVLETVKKLPPAIECSIVMGVIMENVIYLFVYGKGAIFLKRNDKLGLLLENTNAGTIESASGFLQFKDLIILQTEEIRNLIPENKWEELNEVSMPMFFDEISTLISAKKDPLAAMAGILYKEESDQQMHKVLRQKEEVLKENEKIEKDNQDLNVTSESKKEIEEPEMKNQPEMEVKNEPEENNTETASDNSFFDDEKIKIKKPHLTHKKRLLISILLLILIIFGASLYLFYQKQKKDKLNALFNTYYSTASQKYQEGQGLMSLNINLARDDFSTAKNSLKTIEKDFPSNTPEGQKILSLEKNIDDTLSQISGQNFVDATKVDLTTDNFLNLISQNSALSYAWDGKAIYGLTSNSVYSVSSAGVKKTLISSNFKNPVGIGIFYGNIYVFDSTGIYKFASGSFAKSTYNNSSSLDFSKGVSMAIDGSIYILTSNGDIADFYKGDLKTFTVKSLDMPFKNPSLIVTSENDQNIYILDNGNQRIVVLDKSGNFIKSYASPLLKNATEMDVLEVQKTIYFLSSGSEYKISL